MSDAVKKRAKRKGKPAKKERRKGVEPLPLYYPKQEDAAQRLKIEAYQKPQEAPIDVKPAPAPEIAHGRRKPIVYASISAIAAFILSVGLVAFFQYAIGLDFVFSVGIALTFFIGLGILFYEFFELSERTILSPESREKNR